MTMEDLDQVAEVTNADLTNSLRREWNRLDEHADELEAVAEAVQSVTDRGRTVTRKGARHQAAALAAAATRAAVVLGDLQRIAGRIEAYADAVEQLGGEGGS